MRQVEPAGVPSGGDALNNQTPTANDATAGADAPSGDAGTVETDNTAGAEPAEVDSGDSGIAADSHPAVNSTQSGSEPGTPANEPDDQSHENEADGLDLLPQGNPADPTGSLP